MKNICFLAALGVLASCGSITHFEIETHNPAAVTFPVGAENILVVNNSVAQLVEKGYGYALTDTTQGSAELLSDSALHDATRALGQAMAEAEYFHDVLLYHLPTRTDKDYLTDKPFSRQEVDALCRETGADAVVSFDRLWFNLSNGTQIGPEGIPEAWVRMDISGMARAYLPERDTPLAVIPLRDSLFFRQDGATVDALIFLLPSPESILRAAGKYIGESVCPYFVPHWREEARWYFTGQGARWKEATAYVLKERWEQAAASWLSIYHHPAGKWKEKARAASNLALSYEMKGDLPKAHQWAETSKNLFTEHLGDQGKEAKMLALYVSVLQERIRSDRQLSVQLGGE